MNTATTLPLGVATVGGLLPPDTLLRVATGRDMPGVKPAEYGLIGETVNEAAERSWSYLRGRWAVLKEQIAKLPDEDPAVGVTREYWLSRLFHELGFGRLPSTPPGGLASDDGEKHFAISHHWEDVPVHQLGWGVPLDKRTKGVPGAADSAPQSLVQEYLNRSEAALWAVVTNGRLLRVLRDSTALAGSAYVEFDLEAIFDGEQTSSFLLLYRVAHASRFEPKGEDGGPASCWLEKWRAEAIDTGARVLEQLRVSVKEAIETLGTGFLKHSDNRELRAAFHDGQDKDVTPQTLYRALLRTVYRMLFLFVVEDRDLLLDPSASEQAKERYKTYFATSRLRRIAARRHGSRHADQWEALTVVLDALGRESGLPALALPALGGVFEHLDADHALEGAKLANEDLFKAMRSLSRVRDAKTGRTRPVDFRHLGSEELGSVYEGLLEYVPKYEPETGTFVLGVMGGNERKTTGSYYTPASLIDRLLDSALDPVIDEAVKSGRTSEEQEKALLALTVCDPACGSGHFLVAAARRIAKRLAFVRTGDPEPANEAVRQALREVVARCVYGVDLNPMAIELAKVSLWLEAMEPGKPLGFLDAHLKVGNGLIGATPKLIASGLPDAAFTALEGDDKKWVTALKKRNKDERDAYLKRASGVQLALDDAAVLRSGNASLARASAAIGMAPAETLSQVHAQAQRFADLRSSAAYRAARQVADAWCGAFFWTKTEHAPPTVTTGTLLDLIEAPDRQTPGTAAELRGLARRYRFFHWHLEFPEVFRVPEDEDSADIEPATGWAGGFSCVLGNPPWERIKLQEQEFFAPRDEVIAGASNKAARDRLLAKLPEENPDLHAEFLEAKREADTTSHFLRNSGRNPLTGRGDINTYVVFTETGRLALGPTGRLGIIVPTGIATDATTADFFGDLVSTRSLVSIHEFENEEKLFGDVHHSFRFCLLTVAGRSVDAERIELAFRARRIAQLEQKRFELTPDDIARLNPNTLTCPVFDDPRHARIVTEIYRRVPVLWQEEPERNPWAISFQAMFHMANDSHLFHTRETLLEDGWEPSENVFIKSTERMLPLYEAKMVHHFDSRFSTYQGATQAQLNVGALPRLSNEQHADPHRLPLARYWVAENEVEARLKRRGWEKSWLLGWRDICRSSDERTAIFGLIPRASIGHTWPIAFVDTANVHVLLANVSSFVFDYVLRQKLSGTHLTYTYLNQLPVLPPDFGQLEKQIPVPDLEAWIKERVLELSYNAYDLEGFARDLGDEDGPFVWDEKRRFAMRAELDAAYFHLYGVERDDVGYIMDSFRAFQNNDIERFTRTKELILNVYDAMAEAAQPGKAYRTRLDPPPGKGKRHPAVRLRVVSCA